jgi:hypothetical protein
VPHTSSGYNTNALNEVAYDWKEENEAEIRWR